MEIEVGEWVRTKFGCIIKFKGNNLKLEGRFVMDGNYIFDKIVKHSKQLIDLIEER